MKRPVEPCQQLGVHISDCPFPERWIAYWLHQPRSANGELPTKKTVETQTFQGLVEVISKLEPFHILFHYNKPQRISLGSNIIHNQVTLCRGKSILGFQCFLLKNVT